jgi:hypothetical protein
VATVLASSGSSSSSESDSSWHREMRDLVREASEARGQYSDTTQEVDRLESDLVAIQAALHASEEEADVHN